MSNRARRLRILALAGAVLLVSGAVAIVVALTSQQHPPQPSAAAASAVPVTVATSASPGPPHGAQPASPTTRGPLLSRSLPTHVSVPAVGIDSDLKQIGLDKTGAITTPPLTGDSHAYWLNVSPTPGQLGPATIVGHVDSAANGPAVFFRLGAVRQRDTIAVTRADGLVADFRVEKVVEYPKKHFPTQAVYGNTDHAALRLITCGGIFDPTIHSYESNIVVFASLVSSHTA